MDEPDPGPLGCLVFLAFWAIGMWVVYFLVVLAARFVTSVAEFPLWPFE